MEEFHQILNQWLLPLYRLPAEPILGFYLGTGILAVVCAVLGDVALNIAVRADRKRIESYTAEVVKMNNLSIAALEAQDGESYRACNKLANEAFGRMFFLQAALSMASLWPLPLALSWLQERFADVDFPLALVGWKINYFGVFIFIYILMRILYGQVRRRLPFLRGAALIFKAASDQVGGMRSFAELLRSSKPKATPDPTAPAR